MKRILFLIVGTLLFISGGNLFAQSKFEWNGYLQFRFSDNYLDQTGFSVRRAKLWADGSLPLDAGLWSYKIQATFYNKEGYPFTLQDVLLRYRINGFEITAGQFVTDFSLQRNQPDYSIPLVERAGVINSLLPTASSMGRDIGTEIKYKGQAGGVSLGFFNGNGVNTLSSKRNFLYTNRAYINLKSGNTTVEAGYSLAYRKDNGIAFAKIFEGGVTYSGNDFRYGLDAKLNTGVFELQGEYIEAHLGTQKPHGYYVLADYLLSKNDLVALSTEKLNDLNPSTSNNPWYIIGYSRFIKSNYIKISLDNRFQFNNGKTNSLTVLQVQYFFKQK